MKKVSWKTTCRRHDAWNKAREDYLTNGMTEEVRFKRCIKSNDINSMTDDCWKSTTLAYPAG